MLQKNQNFRRNTKNVVKNFARAFKIYLNGQDTEAYQKFSLQYKIANLNNKLIRQIVVDRNLRVYFHKFLKEEADNWIRDSPMQHKQSHFEAVRVYLDEI